MQGTSREFPVEITVKGEQSPMVQIVLKDGENSVFTTKLTFPDMASAEGYAQYMAQAMGAPSYNIISGSQTCSRSVALLIELSSKEFYRILKYANESSSVYSRLKNSIKIATDTFVIPCDVSEAEMLRDAAKQFSPGAVPKIDAAIKSSRGL